MKRWQTIQFVTHSIEQAIKEGRNSQLLLPVADLKTQWKKKARKSYTGFVKTPKGQRRKLL
jgi:hypothetical protein